MPTHRTASTAVIAWAALLDAAFVLVFVVIGRISHGEDLSVSGTLETFWPFFTGLALGWVVTVAWRAPTRVRWPGIPVWLVTVAGGMALRAASMQGVTLSFVLVATVVLGVFLLGWRALGVMVSRPRPSRVEAR
jgi:Protein of unknown function (DUF3054)